MTKKRIRKLDIDSQRVRCSNGDRGTINLPGTVEKRSLPIHKGRFNMKVTASGPYPAQAGTRVTGRLKDTKASGTVRMVFHHETGEGEKVVCDSGTRKWRAKLDELVVHLRVDPVKARIAPVGSHPLAGPAMDPTQLLDVDVHELARP